MITELAFQYLAESATLGSMRLAADKLGVAVSSISRQITQLEESLGVPLIERGRRSLQLTESGRVVVAHYRDQCSNYEAMLNRIRDLHKIRKGFVELAIGEAFIVRPFLQLIEDFQEHYPGVVVSVTQAATAEIEHIILEDQAHLGLIFHRSVEPKIRVRGSVAQPLHVICTPDHSLASHRKVTLKDLSGVPLCLPPKGFRIRQIVAAAGARHKVWLEPTIITTSIQMMREVALRGRCATILTKIAAFDELSEGELVARPLVDPVLEHSHVSLIHRLGRQLDGAPAKLLAMLETQLKKWC